MLLEKSIKVFLNLLYSNTTNIVKDIFIIPTVDVKENNMWLWKSPDTAKSSSNFEKKIRMLIPDKFQEKSPKSMKFGWVIKQNIPEGPSLPVWLVLNNFEEFFNTFLATLNEYAPLKKKKKLT